ncbi:tetratricopeptide repeat protein [Aquidulcibacter sp.]|uniref:tetratricopeptide repeat protein n=1 Tax=Aquidulcibacter sp. TaxID=2052990 RepID=UPI0025BC8FDC|nr:tetratricopeptide repeat protein [Aquidulcibacter sp.]MCA3694993.1 tetratricopeptide repeat protein [Aquidulcibacter sp.]
MRFLRLLPFLFLLPAAAVPVVPGAVTPEVDNPTVYDPPPAQKLKTYYEALAKSGSVEEAARYEGEIYLILTRNASPTINFLMESASLAMEAEDTETARKALTRVTELDPNYAEGLARLATLAYDDGDLVQAESLLKRALRIEPRHFAAWTGLGLVREDLGDYRGAEAAYREALFLHPYLDGAKRGLIRMEARLDGLSL